MKTELDPLFDPIGLATEMGWSGVERLFVVPGFGKVRLQEIDFGMTRGGVAIASEFADIDINCAAAAMQVKESLKGRGFTELMWATDTKLYNLSADVSARNPNKREKLLALARAID